MKARDLFGQPIDENKNPFKPKRNLNETQLKAMRRERTLRYFESEWKKKYNLPYVLPPRSYGYVQLPIEDALNAGYTAEMLCSGIDRYLAEDFKGYTEQKHPIGFFTKDIPKWVGLSQEKVSRQNQDRINNEQSKITEDDVRKLNEKYGILRKGDGWLNEEGKFFTKVEDAIKWAEKHKSK